MEFAACKRGGLGRREFLLALPAAIAMPTAAQTTRPAIATRRLNNVMIAVSDLDRSVAFYRRLFGAPVPQGDGALFRIGEGPHFFFLTQAEGGAKPDFRSYGLTVDDFDPGRLVKTLTGLGVRDAQILSRGGTAELFLRDPNGIRVQLQHAAYGRGAGAHGDVLVPAPRDARPALALRTLNHVTLTIADGAKTQEFYQSVFSLPVMVRQGNNVSLRIGSGTDSIVFNGAASNPAVAGSINHACFTLDNFDPGRVMGVLMDNGLEPIEFGSPVRPLTCRVRLRQRANNGGGPTSPLGTAELYFTDPDNIAIQIQDTSYCGGSGWLGQICP